MFVVLLDTCVLVPPTLADSLLRLSEAGCFGIRWSDDIFAELERTLTRMGVPPSRVDRRLRDMADAFPQARIEGYAPLIEGLDISESDRHVLAAAIRSEGHTIVTFNLKDFPPGGLDAWGVTAVHPDEFLLDQLDLHPGKVMSALAHQAAHYARPSSSVADILGRLSRTGLPRFAEQSRRHLA